MKDIGLHNILNFRHKHSLIGKVKNILFSWGIEIIVVIVNILFLTWLFDLESCLNFVAGTLIIWPNPMSITPFNSIFPAYFTVCVLAPIWEEAVFRLFPLEIVKNQKPHIIWSTVIFSSIIFGILHGSIFNILIQGAGGVVLSWLYLKNNSYWSAVICHSLWNTMLMLGLPVLIH